RKQYKVTHQPAIPLLHSLIEIDLELYDHSQITLSLYFVERYGDHPYLHSFPTRRSSDLLRFMRLRLSRIRKSVISPFSFLKHLQDRKSTRLNSSHVSISYAVFCLKKKIERYITILKSKWQNMRQNSKMEISPLNQTDNSR